MVGQPQYADSRFGIGVQMNPSNTTLGITLLESEYLGKYYWAKGPDGYPRIVKIVKNVRGSALAQRNLLKYSTSAGRFGLDVSITTDDTDPPAGAVEEGYSGGVTDTYYFRMVVAAKRMNLVLQTTSSARCTIANGGIIVAGDDDGSFFGQNSSASNNAVQNRVGFALQATTNGTSDNGANIPCEINLLRE